MKKFIYLLFLFPVLFACEKGAEITPDEGLEELDIGIDDSNDLEKEEEAFLLEGKSELATSRHDVPIIYEVLFEDTSKGLLLRVITLNLIKKNPQLKL